MRVPFLLLILSGILTFAHGRSQPQYDPRDDDAYAPYAQGNYIQSFESQNEERPKYSISSHHSRPIKLDILDSDYFDEKEKPNNVPDAPIPTPQSPVGESIVEEVVTTDRPYCLGCPTDVNTEDDKIKEMASFAFSSHLSGFKSNDQAQKVVRVVNALTQVVAGQKYILDLEVGVTNCTKEQHDQDSDRCLLDPQEETFICNFEIVEQAWANTKEVVRSNCKKENKVQDGDAPISDGVIGGGDVDTTGPEISDDVDAIEDDIDSDEEMINNDLEEATTIAPADISVLDDDAPTTGGNRRKRSTSGSTPHEAGRRTPLLGGQREAEESKEKLMELATFAVQQLDAIDADDDARMVVEILESKKQTVSGWLYTLKLRVAQTTCPEKGPVTMSLCKDKILPPYKICNVKILVQPWQEMQKKVTESQCYPEKYKKGKKLAGKEQELELAFEENKALENDVAAVEEGGLKGSSFMTGGFKNVDLKSETIQELANFVIESIDQQSNALHSQKLVKIVEAKRQIAGGVKTKFIIEMGYTGCRKGPKIDKNICEIDEKRDHQFCDVTVFERPWLKSKSITHSECSTKVEALQRGKRALNVRVLNNNPSNEFSAEDHEQFQEFLGKYDKKYKSQDEHLFRLGVFKENMRKVKLLQDNEQGTAQYGATVFADLTEEEFSQQHLGLRPDLRQSRSGAIKKAKIPYLSSVPNEFDWRNYDAVTPVKNQGFCGSCWAFSVTGNIEGIYAKKYGKLISFSEQELVDCDTLDEGCNGGLPENAYKALQKLGGLEPESAYPYDGHNDKCSFDASKATAKVKGFVELPKNETDMAAWLVKNGPISIGINANVMQFYFGGVSHPWKFLCSKKNLDHGVLIVGYGVHTTSIRHKTLPYWIVKNSWGPNWGEKGYYRVYRGDNTCGIAEMASSAVLE